MLTVHAKPFVDFVRDCVSPIDIKPDTENAGIRLRESANVRVKTGIDALLPEFGENVDALNPPYGSIAPVTPFISDQQRGHDTCAVHAHMEESTRRVFKDAAHAQTAGCAVELDTFGFPRHR